MSVDAVGDLFVRCPANPVLTAADWPYPVNTVFNPAAAVVDGETVLLCRVEDRRGLSHLTVARAPTGLATGGSTRNRSSSAIRLMTRPVGGSRIPASLASTSWTAG